MGSASSTGGRRTLPPLCRVHTHSSAQRRSLSSSLWRRGAHSHMQREGVCHPRYREERYTLLCDEKSLSAPFIEDTLSSVQRRSLPPLHLAMGHYLPCMEKGHSPICTIKGSVSSTHGIGKLSRLYRQDIPSFVKRRDLPPRLIAEGHPLLYVENTLAPLYKQGGGAFSPLCIGDTLYSV